MNRLILSFLLCLWPVLASAEVFKIEDIRIDGLQRVSAGTVFASLPVQAGESVDAERVRQAVRTLFKTGYFDNIRVAREDGVLVVIVTERPAVAEINIKGNKAIETEMLLEALQGAGLVEGQIFRRSVLEGMGQELRRQYVSQGRYGASVDTGVTDLPRNRVAINLEIDEGKVAAIKHINIVGNSVYDDDTLLNLFELQTTGLFSFIKNDDKYSREKLSGDLERLESWYLDRGYLGFSIDSTQVSISPDRDAVFVTVNVSEGSEYTIDKVDLAGEMVIPEGLMRISILTRPGMTFSQMMMTSTTEVLTRQLGAAGYTFAEVEGFPELNKEKSTAKITYFVKPGKRAYVRRIEFRGNTKTADDVLRREMRQMEGASASTKLLERSKVRLERLGYFKDVKMETREVPGTEDQLDVFYSVEEQPSGSIGASLGIAQGSGIILGANISERNFLGSGNAISLGLSKSRYQDKASLSFTDPYFTKDGVSAGYRIAFSATDYGEYNVSDYTTDSMSTGVTFGYPISETSRLSLGFNVEALSIDVGSFPTEEIQHFLADNGDDYLMFSTNLSWSKSTLNRGVLATRGMSQRAGIEFAMPFGDMEYLKASYAVQYLYPLGNDFTLRLKSDLGYGIGLGDTERLPFFKNYYGGGFGSVRGYKRNSLGPQDTPAMLNLRTEVLDENGNGTGEYKNIRYGDSDPFGGNVKLTASAELIFPVPFLQDNRSVQAALFFDAGNIFDTECGTYTDILSDAAGNVTGVVDSTQDNCFKPKFDELRYSVGVGGTWLSGFGPITIAFGKALNSNGYDDTEFFQFSLGQGF